MLNRTVPAAAEGLPASTPTPAARDAKPGRVARRSIVDQANAKQLGTSALTSEGFAEQIRRQRGGSLFDRPAVPELPPIASGGTDPCLAFVTAWNAAGDALAALSADEAEDAWHKTVKPFDIAVNEGRIPTPTTPEGAAFALNKSLSFGDLDEQDAGLVRAALAYLEACPSPHPSPAIVAAIEAHRAAVAANDAVNKVLDAFRQQPGHDSGMEVALKAADALTDKVERQTWGDLILLPVATDADVRAKLAYINSSDRLLELVSDDDAFSLVVGLSMAGAAR